MQATVSIKHFVEEFSEVDWDKERVNSVHLRRHEGEKCLLYVITERETIQLDVTSPRGIESQVQEQDGKQWIRACWYLARMFKMIMQEDAVNVYRYNVTLLMERNKLQVRYDCEELTSSKN